MSMSAEAADACDSGDCDAGGVVGLVALPRSAAMSRNLRSLSGMACSGTSRVGGLCSDHESFFLAPSRCFPHLRHSALLPLVWSAPHCAHDHATVGSRLRLSL